MQPAARESTERRTRSTTVGRVRGIALNLAQLVRLRREVGPATCVEMLADFAREAPQCTAEMERALARGDQEALHRAAHTLRGISGYVGAPELAESCAELEALARGGELAGAGPLVAAMRAPHERFARALTEVSWAQAERPGAAT